MENKREIYEYMANVASKENISHHGIKGQKWYKRRFQNEDGSLTAAGKKRYGVDDKAEAKTHDNKGGVTSNLHFGKLDKSTGDSKANSSTKSTAKVFDDVANMVPDIKNKGGVKNVLNSNNADSSSNRKVSGKSEVIENKLTSDDADSSSNRKVSNKSDVSNVKDDSTKTPSSPKPKDDEPTKPEQTSKPKQPQDQKPTQQQTQNSTQKVQAQQTQNSDTNLSGRKKFEHDIQNMKYMSGISKAASKVTETLKKASDESIKNAPKVQLNLDHMSDAELRNAINRAQLERQYNDYYAPSTVTQGQIAVNKMLGALTTGLAITGSAVDIAIGIKQLLDR